MPIHGNQTRGVNVRCIDGQLTAIVPAACEQSTGLGQQQRVTAAAADLSDFIDAQFVGQQVGSEANGQRARFAGKAESQLAM